MNKYFSLLSPVFLISISISESIQAQGVLINEIMYHPSSENHTEEYIELYNPGPGSVNLSDWEFTEGIRYVFPNVTLGGGDYLVVAAAPASFSAKYPGVTNVVGGWTGGLNNKGEEIVLLNGSGGTVDRVCFADQGEWARKTRGPLQNGHQGWVWTSGHDGGGKSLELRNPSLSNNEGQNWDSSTVEQGTPGRRNSVFSTDIPPMILEVRHFPAIPQFTDAVAVNARLVDELPTGVQAWLLWRLDGETSFIGTAMSDDGSQGDNGPGDGVFGAAIPPQPDGTVVEFYLQARDMAGNSRIYPPATESEGQLTNLLYQVIGAYNPNTPWEPGSRPVCFLILTAAERAELADIGDANSDGINERRSNAQMNGTFISIDGVRTEVRYNVGIRNRGNGTRRGPPNNYRVNFPHDKPWHDLTQLNINAYYPHSQLLGNLLFRMARLPAPEGVPVRLLVNGEDQSETGTRMFGTYALLETFDPAFVDNHFPDDEHGNLYRAKGPSANQADLSDEGDNPDAYRDNYFKRSNIEEDDWSDLIRLVDVLNNSSDETFVGDASLIVNIDQWLRYLALDSLLGNNEGGLVTGKGDDYGLYRGVIDPRFVLLPHDLDTVMGLGNNPGSPALSIFSYTGVAGLRKILTHPETVTRYYGHLLDLLDTYYKVDTLGPTFDRLLGGFVSQLTLDRLRWFTQTRSSNVSLQIPLVFSATSTLPVVDGYLYTNSNLGAMEGKANAALTRSVKVNGQPAVWSPREGTWTRNGTTTAQAVSLFPGINRVIVQAYDGADAEIDRDSVDILYDDGSAQVLSGTLLSDSTLEAQSGPWRITSTITIPASVTLTIEPGTTLLFDPGAGISVLGRLVAEGRQYERIRMTRPPGTTSFWNGLFFLNTLEDNRLAYLDMEYSQGGSESIHVSYSRLFIDNMTWAHTNETIIEILHPSLTIRNSKFPGIEDGEVIHGQHIVGEEYLILDGNIFGASPSRGDVIDFLGAESPGPVFQVLNNVFLGGADDALDLDGTDAHIEGNVFMHFHKKTPRNTTSNAIATGEPQSGGDNRTEITVVRNVFIDNDHAILLKEDAFATVINNTFIRSSIGAIQFTEETGTNVSGPGRGAFIDGNIFWDNTSLFRHLTGQNELTLNRSVVPAEFVGLGVGNTDEDPRLADLGNGDVSLLPGSPGLNSGPNRTDMGAVVPGGVSILGEPPALTAGTGATLSLGGPGISHYRYRLNDEPWSEEAEVGAPIVLQGLGDGTYIVYAIGKNSAGVWQDEESPTRSLTWRVDTSLSRVLINEVFARNDSVFNQQGTHPDAIELHNDGAVPFDLSGKSLTDDIRNPTKYVFPNGVSIPAGGYLVLYADDEAGTFGIHLGFGLKGEGEGVFLFDSPTNGGLMLDSVEFGQQIEGYSIGRVGHDLKWSLTHPTFGSENIPARLGDPSGLKINEWLANGTAHWSSDFIEIYNPDSLPVCMGEFYLSDDPVARPTRSRIPPLSFVGGRGFAVFNADGEGDSGADHVDFRLSSFQEMIGLFNGDGQLIDMVFYGPQTTNVSEGRLPDGSDTIVFFRYVSPSTHNSREVPTPTLTPTGTPTASPTPTQTCASADLSTDSFVDARDLIEFIRRVRNGDWFQHPDLDCDGVADSLDLFLFQNVWHTITGP